MSDAHAFTSATLLLWLLAIVFMLANAAIVFLLHHVAMCLRSFS